MKKTCKSFLISVLMVVLLSTAVFAAGNAKTIEAILNGINVKVNGVQVAKVGDTYTLSSGKTTPFSILYQGTTYLPLRKVAELVNKNISYDPKTETAELNDVSGSEYLPPITFRHILTYDAAAVPSVLFDAYNVSGKDIKYYEVNVFCYNDKFIPITYKETGDNIYAGADNNLLKAGSKIEDNYFELTGLNGTTISYLRLVKVEFADGTKWEAVD